MKNLLGGDWQEKEGVRIFIPSSNAGRLETKEGGVRVWNPFPSEAQADTGYLALHEARQRVRELERKMASKS